MSKSLRWASRLSVAASVLIWSCGDEGPAAVTPVETIFVNPANIVMVAGASHQLTVSLLDAGGQPLDRAADVRWSSSDEAVATVDETGLVTGHAPGVVEIVASIDGRSVTVTAEVGRWARVVAGGTHTCGLSTTGLVYCWGMNLSGQLGISSRNDADTPVRIRTGERFVQLSAGWRHTCALASSGLAYCWGRNAAGQIGDGRLGDALDPQLVDFWQQFVAVSAGRRHTCGLTTGGEAYCWGGNEFGQLGNGDTTDTRLPVSVQGDHQFVEVSAGGYHTCGLTADGKAYCWGRNDRGQLGDGGGTQFSSTPVAVHGEHRFIQLSAAVGHEEIVLGQPGFIEVDITTVGGYHTCGLSETGQAYCWGWPNLGQLGDGGSIDRFRGDALRVPVPVQSAYHFVEICAGGTHTCGLDANGQIHCWGFNDMGQLGTGDTTSLSLPTPVQHGVGSFPVLSAGGLHTCAMDDARMLFCWGADQAGQLGVGGSDEDATTVPAPVLPPATVDSG